MRPALMHLLAIAAMAGGCAGTPGTRAEPDSAATTMVPPEPKYVFCGHSGGKSLFEMVINSRAVYVLYHGYMTKTTRFVDCVDPNAWREVCAAAAAGDFAAGAGTPQSTIGVSIWYQDGRFQSGHLEWDDEVATGSALRKVYKRYLDEASRY